MTHQYSLSDLMETLNRRAEEADIECLGNQVTAIIDEIGIDHREFIEFCAMLVMIHGSEDNLENDNLENKVKPVITAFIVGYLFAVKNGLVTA